MRRIFYRWTVWFFIWPATLGASEPGNFRFFAPVLGETQTGEPVKVSLPQWVVSEIARDFSDLRLFDADGVEIPYVIYEQINPAETSHSFSFEITAFKEEGSKQEIVVKRPKEEGDFEAIELDTQTTDFKKSVILESGPDGISWSPLSSDTIFDFSSRIDLSKKSVKFPLTDAPFVRLILQDEATEKGPEAELSLRYDGLELTTGTKGRPPFRIDRVAGRRGETKPATPVYENVPIDPVILAPDKEGNSVLALGPLNLPLREIVFDVSTPYYHREVELQDADKDDDKAYRVVERGLIFNIPGMKEPTNKFAVKEPAGKFMRLKLINRDNPPLAIRHVELRWPKKNLYFIPEAGRSFRLFFGGEFLNRPDYELGHILAQDHNTLKNYRELSLGKLVPNPSYVPRKSETARLKMEKRFLTLVVLFLFALIGTWIYRLMKKIPAP